MKKLSFFVIVLFTMLSCNSKGTTSQENQDDNIVEQQPIEQQMIESEPQKEELIDNKFLITNTSIGMFSINGWEEDYRTYGYNIANGEECVDACCFGTTVFWKSNESKENPSVILYNKYFEDEQTADSIKGDYEVYSKMYDSRNDLFFVSSDNCSGWYDKNVITGCGVYSSDFKTQENIGVGSSIEDFFKAFNKVYITIGWIEEDADAIQVSVDKYPRLAFIVNSELFNIDWMPSEADRVGEEGSNKYLLHNTDCFTGEAKIVKITMMQQ